MTTSSFQPLVTVSTPLTDNVLKILTGRYQRSNVYFPERSSGVHSPPDDAHSDSVPIEVSEQLPLTTVDEISEPTPFILT